MKQDNNWVRMHFKELRTKYPGKYLAIFEEKVVASGFTAKEVLNQVKDEDLKKVRFIHIPKTKRVFY